MIFFLYILVQSILVNKKVSNVSNTISWTTTIINFISIIHVVFQMLIIQAQLIKFH
jgi:HJR/Mrr/RecB family endonuclease